LIGQEAAHQAGRDRASGVEDDRDRRGCTFRCACRNTALGYDQIDLAPYEVGRKRWQPIIAAIRPAVFDCQAMSFDPGFVL
jgi:hypothetical protein